MCWRQKALKQAKNVFLACFRAYVGQPDDHIGLATSMPFSSIYPTDPRTNSWNFRKKIFRIGSFEKLSFFESAIKKNFFCFINQSTNHKLFVRMNGTQFLGGIFYERWEILNRLMREIKKGEKWNSNWWDLNPNLPGESSVC